MALATDDVFIASRRMLQRGMFGHLINVATHVAAQSPEVRRARARLDIDKGVAYGPLPEQRLDVYRPRFGRRPLPVLLYVHGGGFTLCSKETHRSIAALNAAHAEYLVFNIDYRLAPGFCFPAAVEDACAAYCWVVENAERYGGDPTRIVVAGESAGGNLALGVAVAACYPRPEEWAGRAFELGKSLRGVQPIMPFLQVSSPMHRSGSLVNGLARQLLHDIADAYLGAAGIDACDANIMADPIRVLESDAAPTRPLPPVFAAVGTADLCHVDVQRLEVALERLGVDASLHYYDGEPHGFQLMRWRPNTRQFWRDNFTFLKKIARA